MGFGEFNPDRVPIYIEASNKQNLVAMMLIIQKINSKNYNFMSPVKEGNKWVVWFYGTIGQDETIEEKQIKNMMTVIGEVDAINSK